MPKYILGTGGKLIKTENISLGGLVSPSLGAEVITEIEASEFSKEYGSNINKDIDKRNSLNYMEFSTTPSINDVNVDRVISETSGAPIQAEGDFVETENFQRYLPFNSYSDEGDDANNTYAFANIDSKTQLAEGFSGNREIVFEVLEEAFQIFISTFLVSVAFEALYAQWKEDVRSKTDFTFGSHRQYASINILDNFIELLHKEANWPKTKSGAVSSLATGLLVDFTNTDVVKVIKDLDIGGSTGSAIGFPGSIITLFLNNVVDGLLNSQDVFNRVKLRLRRISLDAAYKRIVKDRRSTVRSNFGFTDFANTYYFKYIVERINIGEKLLTKYVLGDHPLGYNADTRYLPENALTRLMKSKKGPLKSNFPGNQSASPLRLTALESSLNVGHEIQRAISLNTDFNKENNLKDLGALATKFRIRKNSDKQNRFSKEEVESLENRLEAEYVPFYFQDLRNNEIMAFHAFIESISDSFNPTFNETDGYGRIESVKTYSKTTRNISVNFTLAAMNPDDHDYMWFCVNRLVAMCYPQWSKGAKVDGGFTQPFSQIPTATPVVRMRLGDLFKSNYSLKNLSRLFGVGDEDFSITGSNIIGNTSQYKELGITDLDRLPGGLTKGSGNTVLVKTEGEGIVSSANPTDTLSKTIGETSFFREGSRALFGLPFTDLSGGDIVQLSPGVYPEDTNGFTQFLGAAGIKATVPNTLDGAIGRTYFKNNNYLKCKIVEYSESTSLLSFFGGPSDEGKSHVGFYILEPINMKGRKILASHDSISLFSEEQFVTKEIAGGPELIEGFMKPDNGEAGNLKIFNPIVKAFESSRGRGLAGVITQLDYNYNDSTWETSRIGSKAPQFMRVQLTFSPIHDIPLGLDHKGFMRAPAYPVGKVNRVFFGDPYDKKGKDGLSSAIRSYEEQQKIINDLM